MGSRAYPYRVSDDHVAVAPWYSTSDGAPLGELLPTWDYNSVLKVHRRVDIDVAGLLEDCGLPETARLALNVRYWPTTSLIRRTAVHVVLEGPDANGTVTTNLATEIQGEDLASALTIQTSLILEDTGEGAVEPFVAHRPGSVLWQDVKSVKLEGTAGLLPVAPVSFREQGLPEQAAWYVSLDSSEWQSAAMGSLLVLLNDDNPAVKSAIEKPDDPASAVVLDALTVDVVCDLIGRALQDEEFPVTPADLPKHSEITTGGLVHGLIRAFLARPAETVDEAITRLRDEWQRDPSRVRAQAQNGLRFPGSRMS